MNQIPKQEDHVLQINMLGDFSMECDHIPISFERQRFSKSIHLLILLLLSRETGMRKDELLKYLYDRGQRADLNNNLNNMVCRLRRQIREMGFPEGDDIIMKGGWCRYVSNGQIKVDAEELERLMMRAEDPEIGPEEKKACLLEAVGLYQGDLLPRLSDVTWVVIQRMRCRKLYETAIEQLEPILAGEGDYQKLYELYSHAVQRYPLKRFQEKQLACLAAMNQEEKVFQRYQETTQLYSDCLGIPPFKGDMGWLRKVEEKLFGYTKSLEMIREDLQEKDSEPGAYYCSYPSFMDCSSLLVRNGKKAVLLLCTLENDGEGTKGTAGVIEITIGNKEGKGQGERRERKNIQYKPKDKRALWLRQSIQEGLRREDIYTRYSQSQYLALLMGAEPEDVEPILSRITQQYEKLSGSCGRELRFETGIPGHYWQKQEVLPGRQSYC